MSRAIMTEHHIIGENTRSLLRMGTGRRAKMEKKAYPITYGILGLLAFWGPLSGYDIKRLFDHTLSTMWGAAQSQIYQKRRKTPAFMHGDRSRTSHRTIVALA
jgi:hypothetical protein